MRLRFSCDRIEASEFRRDILLGGQFISQKGLVCNHAASDTHGLEFLYEEFGRIGDLNVGELGRVVTGATVPDALLVVCDGDEAALAARVALERVRALHEALLGEFRHAVTYDAVTHNHRDRCFYNNTVLFLGAPRHNEPMWHIYTPCPPSIRYFFCVS